MNQPLLYYADTGCHAARDALIVGRQPFRLIHGDPTDNTPLNKCLISETSIIEAIKFSNLALNLKAMKIFKSFFFYVLCCGRQNTAARPTGRLLFVRLYKGTINVVFELDTCFFLFSFFFFFLWSDHKRRLTHAAAVAFHLMRRQKEKKKGKEQHRKIKENMGRESNSIKNLFPIMSTSIIS